MPTEDREEQEYERRRQHIEELKEKITAISGFSDNTFVSPDCPDEVAEKFLEQVLAFEDAEQKPLADALTANGITLPPPEELDDAQLKARLWEVINAMSLFGHYLHNTDHLSDRELYEHLTAESLKEPTTLLPQDPDFSCHIDLVGTGSDEDIRLYLTYYADEEAREQWARDWPDEAIPAHEDPPYDRDRHLPKCPGW